MINELVFVFIWWFVIFILGLIFLPTTILLFPKFLDRGYIFCKTLGLIFVGYGVWLVSSLKIIPFNLYSIALILALAIVVNTLLAGKRQVLESIRDKWPVFVFEEVMFIAAFIGWIFIKAHDPSIHSLEKFMDFGFINSILRSDYFPPKDLWLTPETINYYYFGHFIIALLTKISGIDQAITYNLMLCTIFGLAFVGSFSIGSNLYFLHTNSPKMKDFKISTLTGFLSAFLVTLSGNLQTIYVFFQSYNMSEAPIPFWKLPLQLNFSGYWYPNATRFIPFTIHEFPSYSFVVSDLHGHVFSIPTVILTIALLVTFYIQKVHLSFYLLLGLILSVLLMTNVLDLPIYLMFILIVIFFKDLQKGFVSSLLTTTKFFVILAFLVILFSLPFLLAFKPFSSGIGVLCSPKFLTSIGKIGSLLFEADHCGKSPVWMLAVIYGFFYLTFWGFSFKILKDKLELNIADKLVFIFGLFATITILIPEFLYIKDIYPAHYRANTVFKFGYQAFITFSLICGYMITRITFTTKKGLLIKGYLVVLLFALMMVSIYPYFAINSYFNGLKNYQGLDGLKYLSAIYPYDYQAVVWLNQTIKGQPVILEAQGDSYTDYARVSSNTGLPTVIGWPVHEWLWRGSYDEAGKRSSDVKTLYENPDYNTTLSLIKKYRVNYVFIGNLERQKYPDIKEDKWNSLGQIVFQNSQTTIFKLN